MSISRRANINISSIIDSDSSNDEIILSNESYQMIFLNVISNQCINIDNNIKKYIKKNKYVDSQDEIDILIAINTIVIYITSLYHSFFTTSNSYDNRDFNRFKAIIQMLPEDKRINIRRIQYNIILSYVETLYNKLITSENIFEKNYNMYNEIYTYLKSYEALITRNHEYLGISESNFNFLKNYLNYIINIINIIKFRYEHINVIYNRLTNKSFQNRLRSYISNSNLKSVTSLRHGGINEYINYKYKNKIYNRKLHYDGNKKYIIINKNRIYI